MVQFAFIPLQNALRKNVDDEGKWIVQKFVDANEEFDSALNNFDVTRTVEILKENVLHLKELIPHIKSQSLRKLCVNFAAGIESKVQDKDIEFVDLVKFGLQQIKYFTTFFGLPFPNIKNK